MLAPGLIAMILVVFIPVFLNLLISVLSVNLDNLGHWIHAPFAGLKNYVNSFVQGNVFGVKAGRSIFISFSFSLLTTAGITPIGILAALSVYRPFRGRALVRALYLVPYVIPTFVTGIIGRIMFLNHYGLVDKVLAALHIASVNTYWLLGPNAFWAMTLTDMWAAWPFIYLLTLAALQSIPLEQYESATIDGAGSWRKLFSITFPQIGGILELALLLSTLNHFGNFTLPYVMFSSPPPTSVDVLPINTYFHAFTTFDFGIASAISVMTMLILLVPGYIYLRMTHIGGQGSGQRGRRGRDR